MRETSKPDDRHQGHHLVARRLEQVQMSQMALPNLLIPWGLYFQLAMKLIALLTSKLYLIFFLDETP